MTIDEMVALATIASGGFQVGETAVIQSLAQLGLVEPINAGVSIQRLTDRGRAFVDHILALPLPEQVTVWRIPGAPLSERVEITGHPGVPVHVDTDPIVLIDDDGPPPPKPARPKPIPGITPAEDPQARRAQVLELINRGFGTSEIADTLDMAQEDVDAVFFAGH